MKTKFFYVLKNTSVLFVLLNNSFVNRYPLISRKANSVNLAKNLSRVLLAATPKSTLVYTRPNTVILQRYKRFITDLKVTLLPSLKWFLITEKGLRKRLDEAYKSKFSINSISKIYVCEKVR